MRSINVKLEETGATLDGEVLGSVGEKGAVQLEIDFSGIAQERIEAAYLRYRMPDGVRVEVANKDVVVPSAAWAYNAAEMRHEAVITDAAITPERDVTLSVPDERNGKVVLSALRPAQGSITVYTTDAGTTASDLTLRMSVTEVRSMEV